MGCSPSQAVIVSNKTENSHLHPTIYMVGEKSLQVLKELGELKFYHFGQYSEAQGDVHNDFAAMLENPLHYSGKDGQSESLWAAKSCSHNYSGEEKSINTKMKAGCVIDEPGWHTSYRLTNEQSVNLSNVFANQATKASPILLSPKSLAYSKDIRINAQNSITSPIFLSGESHLNTPRNRAQNLSGLTNTAFPGSIQTMVTDAKAVSSAMDTAADPLDKIASAPDGRCASRSAETSDDCVAPKTLKPKTFFGRNRIKPKQEGKVTVDNCKTADSCNM